ncbi:MAG: cation:proton antiporter [Bacillota bacterium]|nr:cation:proton antiporter [Bacillota bacterium]
MVLSAMDLGAKVLVVLVLGCLYRAYRGPSFADRVAAVNLVGTKAVALIILFALAREQFFFLDVALVYALINFLMTVGLAYYGEQGREESHAGGGS